MNVTLFIFCSFLIAIESSKCPEPRKPHPTSCVVFYNCVNLPDGGYVWAPRRCTEGLVFQPYLRMCILPGDSWTCDLTTESVVTNKYDTPELINPNESSYLGSTEDPANFSELVDSSYVTEDIADSNYGMMTPYPLIKIEEAMGNQPQKVISNLPNNAYKKEYLMLNRLMQHLSIHKEITIPLELLASLSTPLKATSIAPAKQEFSKASQQSLLMSYFVQNRVQQTNVENTVTATAKSQDPVEYSTKNEEKSMTNAIPLNDTLEGLLNDSENEHKLIVISSNSGERQFFTVEKYKTLGYRVDPKFIQVIPCVANVRSPNTTDCIKYYICKPELITIIEHTCPPFTAFNKYSRICDRESYSKCKENSAEKKVEINEQKFEGKAPGKVCTENGKTKDTTSDSHYYVCYSTSDNSDNLKSIRMSCPNSLIFCQNKKVCTTRRLCKGA